MGVHQAECLYYPVVSLAHHGPDICEGFLIVVITVDIRSGISP